MRTIPIISIIVTIIFLLISTERSTAQDRESSQIFFTGIGQLTSPESPDSWSFTDGFIFIISDYNIYYQIEQYSMDGQLISSHIYEYYRTITDKDEYEKTKGILDEDQGFEYIYKDMNDEGGFIYSSEKLNEMSRGMQGYIRLQLPDQTVVIFTLAKPSKSLFEQLIDIGIIE